MLGRQPLPHEQQWLRANAAVQDLRHCEFLPGHTGDAKATVTNTVPNAWVLAIDRRTAYRDVLRLGYARDEQQFASHTNFNHPTARIWVQVSRLTHNSVRVMFFNEPSTWK